MMTLLAIGLVLAQPAPKPAAVEHAAGCPRECAPCSQAVDKGLKFLAARQERDGSYAAGNAGPLVHSAMAGLAFLAAGSTAKKGRYSLELAACRDYLLNELDGPNMNMVYWNLAYTAIFFSQLHLVEPSDRLKTALKRLVGKIEAARHKNGGWIHGKGLVAQQMKKMNYSKTIAVVTIHCVAALSMAQACGVRINKDALEKSIKYLEDLSPGGEPCYSPELPWPMGAQGTARAGAILAVLPALRESEDAFLKSLQAHARRTFRHLSAATGDPHPYVNYWMAAAAMYRHGDEDWKRTLGLRNQILGLQKENGAWEPEKAVLDIYGGPAFFTASYVLILALPMEYLPMARRK
jgi:hypothetical protein